MITVGTHMIEQGVEMLCHELDRILARQIAVFEKLEQPRLEARAPAVLAFYFNHGDGGQRWTVIDLANGYERLLLPTSRETATGFVRRYLEVHPDARFDGDLDEEFSVRVPSNVVPIREGVA